MQLFVITRNRLKVEKFKIKNIDIAVYPIYFLEIEKVGNSASKVMSFLNYILDHAINDIISYNHLPAKPHYFIFKHPNIMEQEEEYAKESAKTFGLRLIHFKKGWAIQVVSKLQNFKFQNYETDIKNFAYQTFANPLLDIFISQRKFHTRKITKPVRHNITLPDIENEQDLRNFYNFITEELRIIFKSYEEKFNRKPNIAEIGTFAQYWSEHCRHKTMKGTYFVDGRLAFSNLLKETIFEVTQKLKRKWCVSVFEDNAGVIDVDGRFCVCAKVETHNHPSSIEPYSGSATGIGGVIRDIIGTGKGAKPIGSIDIFFVGNINNSKFNSVESKDKMQNLVWEPCNLLKNLVCGVRDYGNRMGIPTVSGSVYFDDSYLFNPLVYCGTIGIIEKNKVKKEVLPGDLIILIGDRTGRDGLHGASFSSGKISKEESNSAILSVQLPNPIVEKKVEQFINRATRENIIKSVTDCGAGGIAVASLEIIQNFGAHIKLEDVKIKYKGLSPYELWLSETQERMIVVIDKNDLNKFIEIAKEEEVDFTILGNITKSPVCKIYFKDKIIAEFHKDTLDRKIPQKKFYLNSFTITKPEPVHSYSFSNLRNEILNIISNPIVASKENIIRRYDHEVGGRTVIKPIINNISPANGCVLKLFYDKNVGVAIGLGHKTELMKVDPYEGSIQSIDEAVRNVITLGANPAKISLLDNFCWGDSQDTDQLYKLIESARACKDLGLIYKTPFISGKDSFNNFFVDAAGRKINITPTLLITAIGIVDNISYIPSTILKGTNSRIYFVGSNQFMLAGSIFYKQYGYTGKFYPKLKPHYALKLYKLIYTAIKKNMISSIHDVSDGGIITTIIEMFLDSNCGVELNFESFPNKQLIFNLLFSEPPSSFIVEIDKEKIREFIKLFENFFCFEIGKTTPINNYLLIKTPTKLIQFSKDILKKHYLQPLSTLF